MDLVPDPLLFFLVVLEIEPGLPGSIMSGKNCKRCWSKITILSYEGTLYRHTLKSKQVLEDEQFPKRGQNLGPIIIIIIIIIIIMTRAILH
jgi:hypothetical protein